MRHGARLARSQAGDRAGHRVCGAAHGGGSPSATQGQVSRGQGPSKRKAKPAETQGRSGKGRDHGGTKNKRSYSSSESSSGSSDFTDSSSDDGGHAARKSSNSSATSDYQRVFESTQHASRAPAFVWMKGEPHFRSRNCGDLVHCARQPKPLAVFAATATHIGKGVLTAAAGSLLKSTESGPGGGGATIRLLAPPPHTHTRRPRQEGPAAIPACQCSVPCGPGMARLPGAVLQMIAEAKYDLQMPSPSPTPSPASERQPLPTWPSPTPAQRSKGSRKTPGTAPPMPCGVSRSPSEDSQGLAHKSAYTTICSDRPHYGIGQWIDSSASSRQSGKVLEKFKWIQPIVCPMDWKMVDAAGDNNKCWRRPLSQAQS